MQRPPGRHIKWLSCTDIQIHGNQVLILHSVERKSATYLCGNNNLIKGIMKMTKSNTYTLASSLPRSFTGVPDLGVGTQPSGSSSGPRILPGHHDPFLRRTQTKDPAEASMPLLGSSPEHPIYKPKRKNGFFIFKTKQG